MLIVSAACWSILYTSCVSLVIVSDSNAQAPINQSNWWCPNRCKCIGVRQKTPPLEQRLICTAMDIQLVPCPSPNSTQHIIPHFVFMDLSHNNVTRLDDFSFRFYPNLEVLKLSGNRLSEIADDAFVGLSRLSELYLQENELEHIPAKAFEPLVSLEKLHIGKNRIRSIAPTAFQSLPLIRHLYLEKNALVDVPVLPISFAPTLAVLSLADNRIERLADWSFLNSSRLQMLSLASNSIRFVAENAFAGLAILETLELQHNSLAQIPSGIQLLPALRKLSVAFNQVTHVSNEAFKHNMKITHVDILGNPVISVGRFAFHNFTQLKILIIPEARELNKFPDVNGSRSLEFLRIDRAHLRHVPDDLCEIARNLKTLDLKSNDLRAVPRLDTCLQLRQLQLSNNKIRSLDGTLFRHQNLIHDLLLSNNIIETIPADAFVGLDKLEILNLMGNHVQMIHPDAFLPLKKLVFLNVAENAFPLLPSRGLGSLLQLHAFNIPQLKDFPPPDSLPKANILKLSYAYHCCQFMASLTTNSPFGRAGSRNPSSATTGAADSSTTQNHGQNGQTHAKGLQETVVWLPRDKVDLSLWSTNSTDIWPAYHNLTPRLGDFAEDLWGSLGPDYVYPSNLPQVVEEYFEDGRVQLAEIPHRPARTVTCTPLPGPFMPCEDLFDWWTLRCGVWIVFLLSMLGNGAVVFVLVFSRSKMDVPRFLVCNLAGADLLMGVYLGFLAVVDASTLGQFKMHALRWQYSVGCQLAGFLGVLSSELGVFTLAVITLERNYAITHAMHLNKRLSLRHASYIMATGWAFAIITASLPLFGISDYRRFAICLPFDTSDSWALAYVVFLMSANGIAFLILMGCYLKMYCAIRGSQAWNSNDSRIAKRMALLVFTDFLCWAPIAFFSLTAAFGLNLVSLEEAKVFTVFVLPLNSCANPFLYAILTKQFKKDCVLICKAIEESRVTRGIGRCRHSSNFSNRQTPANTNSLVDRNSSNTTPAVACNCSLHGPITLGSRTMLAVGEAGPGTMARLLVSGGTTIASSAVVLGATGSHHLHHHQHHVHHQQTHHHALRHLHKKQELNESEATGSGSASGCEVGSGVLLTTSAVAGTAQVTGRGGLDVAAAGRHHHHGQRLGHHVRHSTVRAFLARIRCSLLCHAVLDEEPVDSAAEYAYALAELQKSQQKHSRNLSVSSSDNFSSSRSDSWRQPSVNRGRPLDRAARRNSWSVSRKPSQDSNLSNSRNDSSATTASTSTWRVSRSSVSSGDAAAAAAAAAANNNHGHLRPDSPPASTTAVQANSSCTSASVPANGTNPSHDLDWLPPDTPPSHPSVRFVLPGEQVVAVPQAMAARPKPKLRRQVAMSEEHSPPQALTAMFLCGRGERDKEREREVFVTRKLSTISSKSGNLYGDMVSGDVEQAAATTTGQGSVCGPESDALLTRPCPPTVAGISEDDGHLETEPFLNDSSRDGMDETVRCGEIKESNESWENEDV